MEPNLGKGTYRFKMDFLFEAPTLTDARLLGQAVARFINNKVEFWRLKVESEKPNENNEKTVYKDYGLKEETETLRKEKMVYCILVRCNDDFKPTKSTDIPKTGQVLLRYPWTGSKAAAEALAANRYRVRGGTGSDLIGNIWVVLYIADKEPQHGEVLEFEPLKNVLRLDDPEEKE